jgi:threonine dehydrogenase-like Zn-dependent dehydrogenase
MKALQVTAPGEFVVLDVPQPEPGPGEVLLHVQAVTTCPQWDLHLKHNEPMFVGHQFRYPYPLGQPGHEASGVIAALGPGVAGLAVGERVSAWRDPGHDQPGCYAEYVAMQAGNVIRVPAELPPAATAPLELAMCVGASFLALKEMGAVRGRRFGVMGLGPAGLIALQMARSEGAREVVAFDIVPARRERALALGADVVYDPRVVPEDLFPVRPGETRIESAIDCVGARASVEWLMDRCGGELALFGVQRENYTFAPRHWRGLRLIGYPGHSREAAEYAVGLLTRAQLDLLPLVTHTLPLERYDEGIALLERQEAIKVCFLPGG